jgi:hyperosmotically inducible protein
MPRPARIASGGQTINMKRNIRRMNGFLGIALMMAPLAGAAITSAVPFESSSSSFEQARSTTAQQQEIDRLLKQILAKATVVSRHADTLDAFTRPGARLHATSHAAELNGAKEAINSIGDDFRQLKELRASGLPWQQSLVDRLEPVLMGLAGHTTDAIEHLNAGSHKLPSQEYRDTVDNLNAWASQTRTLVAVHMDYSVAREKLNRLDASPVEPVAKVSTAPVADTLQVSAPKPLAEQVRSELLTLPYYSVFDHLAFQVDGDEVTLTGEVSWPTLKADAERVVRDIEGVETLRSDIKVLPLSPNDNRIRWATYSAIYGQSNLGRYRFNPHPPVRIIVENGHVTLKGVVANEMERIIAYTQANSVPGAFSVTNHLEIGS